MSQQIAWSWLVVLVLATVGWSQDKGKEKPYLVLDAGGHTSTVKQVLFSEGGKEVITVSHDKTIRIWDAATGQSFRTLRVPIGKGRYGMLFAAALHPDRTVLAVAGYGETSGENPIYLIRLSDGRIEKVLRGHNGVILCLAFAHNGSRLASGSADNTARVWDLETGHCVHVLKAHTKPIYCVAFSPVDDRLATGSDDHTGRIWNLVSGKSQKVLNGHEADVGAIAWSRDGKRLATGGYDQAIRLWDRDGELVQTFGQMQGNIVFLRFFAKDREILFTTYKTSGGIARAGCLELYGSGKVRAEKRHNNTVYAADVDLEERWAVSTGGSDRESFVWQLRDGKEVSRLVGHGRTPFAAGWSPDGTDIAWGNLNSGDSPASKAPLERTFSLEQLEIGPVPTDRFGGRRIELGSARLEFEGINALYLNRPGQKLTFDKFRTSHERVQCGTLLSPRHAVIGADFGLYLFELDGGKRVRTFVGHTAPIWSVAASPNGRYILSAGGDQTLRVWTLDHDEPLVSFFIAGQEWVAWTPEGYYAASPGGEHLMGWHVNNGPDKMASFYPAAQFRKSLYRPDVIKLLLRTGSVERALEIADAALGKKAKTTEVANVLPPKVRFTAPEKSTAVSVSSLNVRARASSTGTNPVTAMQLLIDGRPFEGKGGFVRVESPKLGDVDASWSITLSPGKHRLTVRAESAVSSGLSDEVEVHYAAADQSKRPSLYILTVGISDYAGNLKLNYAAKDAQTLAKTFQDHSHGVFEKIAVKELTNQKATQREILKGITWLGKQMTQRDVAIVFLAGHGEVANNGAFYFLPADVDPDDIAASGVHGEQIKTMLAAMPGRVMFLLDACHAGAAGKTKRRAGGALTDDLIRDLAADERGVIVMGASTGRQFSLESEEHGHGLFTLALIEGLQGKAKRVDGAVYLHNLNDYVTDRVRELSRGEQSPTTARPASIRSFPLSRP